ncbi:o-succinylbenzoate synthase [Demequina sp. TTPB684]|uniref:o-succinylbenzoate synthase n=1 Tax=unclassified Demequina TaxID=2620311 RepID=UPI001CF3FCC0|nr:MULTISPECIES: o-succinylbenzoate synthase [unclassified Demequina]MCB2411474.1 o-succinylbenzoate synthase [Demequina sp. TTPB684]UPU88303.1 o-succinylbenzoate synthase [Demequina sp. TMPB413]
MEFRPFSVTLNKRFRGLAERTGVLFRGTGPDGADAWGEYSPFADYNAEQRNRWWAAAMEAATGQLPTPVRPFVETAAIIPDISPEAAAAFVLEFGCRTAKVKVGGPRGADPDPAATLRSDVERVEAVASALGRGGKLRIDANASWTLAEAGAAIKAIEAAARAGGLAGLEYVEQPCATIGELAALRRRVDVPIAADESIRLTGDVTAVLRAEAADILVLKPSPLGGARACLQIAEHAGLPVVISSAMESSVGLASALAAALALPDAGLAHGLGTGTLLATDTVEDTLVPVAGRLTPRTLRVTA